MASKIKKNKNYTYVIGRGKANLSNLSTDINGTYSFLLMKEECLKTMSKYINKNLQHPENWQIV